jgi:hypothetical protein
MTSKKSKINLQSRRSRVMHLRKTGATLETIAALISTEFELPNYDRRRCFDDVDAVLSELNETCSHSAEEYRRQQLEDLDSLRFKLEPAIQKGDIKAINSAVGIIDRKCKLLGLDAPVQLMVKQQAEAEIETELRSFLAQVEAIVSPETFSNLMDAVVFIGERSKIEK